jgi:LuxR family maltose regulon positive regulatory protein
MLPSASEPSLPAFTPAELRLLSLLPTELSFPQMGRLLCLSPDGVTTQADKIYRKLGVGSRREAIQAARSLHLLGPTQRV